MNIKDKETIVPPQQKGGKSTAVKRKVYKTVDEAKTIFNEVKLRLLDVNNWSKYSFAHYELVRSDGSHKNGIAQETDIIKIDIPGPASTGGKGYDWVQIEKIKNEESLFAIEVRMTAKPGSNVQTTDHFYTGITTNTFSVEQHGKEIICQVNGRNMVFNLQHKTFFDKIRNFITGLFSEGGGSKLFWKDFLHHLMTGKEKKTT
jgi:hypothetical protein